MTYASTQDIQDEFKGQTVFSSTGPVSPDALAKFLTQADAQINNALTIRYTLPITDTDALDFLKKIAIDIVAYRVAKIFQIKKTTLSGGSAMVQGGEYYTSYKEALKTLEKLSTGGMKLFDAALIPTYAGLDYGQLDSTDGDEFGDSPIW